ncbi:MAG: YfiR family protein [Candidatus Marinimicrobia bacterium]|nr:YfiR family protein [Candidatus Neomarinimicrobiota bacterium]
MKRYYPKTFIRLNQAGIICLLLLFTTAGFAQEMPVPVELQLSLFTKILTFDKNLEQRSSDSLRIAVVYQKLYRHSDNTWEAFFSAAEMLKLRQIKGIPVLLLPHDLHTTAELREFISEQKINIIYIAPLRAAPVNEITDISRELKVLSLSGVTDYMKHGVSVGLDIKGDRPEILINQNNASREGADFSSRLLHLAKIIN